MALFDFKVSPPPDDGIKEERNDLRIYLTEVIKALRWSKDRQLRLTFYTVAIQAAFLSEQLQKPVHEMLGTHGVACISLAISFIYSFLVIDIWLNIKKLRQREKRILDQLSPRLLEIIEATKKSKKYDDVESMRPWDVAYFFAQMLLVLAITMLHSRSILKAIRELF